MTLFELSGEYQANAAALRSRISELRSTVGEIWDEGERRLMEQRIHTLETMWREARDLAILTERYYERGYRRNAKYTI